MKIRLLPAVVVTLSLAASAFAKTGWIEDYEKGLAKAKAENKPALVNFTGSDWCILCKHLDDEVFSKATFKEYVRNKYVLVEVDFPQLKPLSEAKQKLHMQLGEKFNVPGFPTILVLSPDGKEIGRLSYAPGGPGAFIAELEKLKK